MQCVIRKITGFDKIARANTCPAIMALCLAPDSGPRSEPTQILTKCQHLNLTLTEFYQNPICGLIGGERFGD